MTAQLHMRIIGDAALPPALFVHGFPIDSTMWDGVAAKLSRRVRCLLPDLRGIGRSAAPSDSCTIADYADDLASALDEAGEQRPVVFVGLSMGGIIGFEFFRRRRARMRALVLSGSRPYPETADGRARRELMAQAALRKGSGAVADLMITNVFAPDAPPDLVRHWHGVMSANPPEGVAAGARALASRADSVPLLPSIDLPTLLVFGEEDRITPLTVARDLQKGIRGSRLVVIPGCGHVPPVERTEEFIGALDGFLDQLGM